jgi:hypothetical protein
VVTSRKHPETTERHEPVITYSRVTPRGAPARAPKGARQMEIERIDPFLAETAVPLVPPRPRIEPEAAPGLHAQPFDLDEAAAETQDIDVLAKERRPRSAMVLIVGAVVAVAAGIGVLLVSFNGATLTTADGPSASEGASAVAASPAEPAEGAGAETNDEMIADIEARLAALEGRTIPAEGETIPSDAENVRQISLSPGETVSAESRITPAPTPVPPPAPRLRPERVASATPVDTIEPSAPAALGKPLPQAAAPAATADDDFIATIERALADNPPAPAIAGADPTLEPGLLPPVPAEDGVALDMLPTSDFPVPPEPIPDVGSIQ